MWIGQEDLLLALAIIGAVLIFWRNALRAREEAIRVSRAACKARGYNFSTTQCHWLGSALPVAPIAGCCCAVVTSSNSAPTDLIALSARLFWLGSVSSLFICRRGRGNFRWVNAMVYRSLVHFTIRRAG